MLKLNKVFVLKYRPLSSLFSFIIFCLSPVITQAANPLSDRGFIANCASEMRDNTGAVPAWVANRAPRELGLNIAFPSDNNFYKTARTVQDPTTGLDVKVYPTVVHVHGVGASIHYMDEQMRLLAQKGFIAISINYRESTSDLADAQSIQPYEDVSCAIRWLKKHAMDMVLWEGQRTELDNIKRELNLIANDPVRIDAQRIGLSGHSMGGVISHLIATDVTMDQIVKKWGGISYRPEHSSRPINSSQLSFQPELLEWMSKEDMITLNKDSQGNIIGIEDEISHSVAAVLIVNSGWDGIAVSSTGRWRFDYEDENGFIETNLDTIPPYVIPNDFGIGGEEVEFDAVHCAKGTDEAGNIKPKVSSYPPKAGFTDAANPTDYTWSVFGPWSYQTSYEFFVMTQNYAEHDTHKLLTCDQNYVLAVDQDAVDDLYPLRAVGENLHAGATESAQIPTGDSQLFGDDARPIMLAVSVHDFIVQPLLNFLAFDELTKAPGRPKHSNKLVEMAANQFGLLALHDLIFPNYWLNTDYFVHTLGGGEIDKVNEFGEIDEKIVNNNLDNHDFCDVMYDPEHEGDGTPSYTISLCRQGLTLDAFPKDCSYKWERAVPACFHSDNNRLLNPDLETSVANKVSDGVFTWDTLPFQWTIQGKAKTMVSRSAAHSGDKYALLQGTNSTSPVWNSIDTNAVSVKPNTHYRVSAYVMSSGSDIQARMGIRQSNGDLRSLSITPTTGLPTYSNIELCYYTGNFDHRKFYVGFWSTNENQWLRVDDTSVKEDSSCADLGNLLVNPGFESNSAGWNLEGDGSIVLQGASHSGNSFASLRKKLFWGWETWSQQVNALEANKLYKFSAYVDSNGLSNLTMKITPTGLASRDVGVFTHQAGAGYQKIESCFKMPNVSGARAFIGFYTRNNTTYLRLDDTQLVAVDSCSP